MMTQDKPEITVDDSKTRESLEDLKRKITLLNEAHKKGLIDLLENHLWQLDNIIRRFKVLSEPVKEGHWRWADYDSSGQRLKSKEELREDRQRASAQLVRYEKERHVVEETLKVITEDWHQSRGDQFEAYLRRKRG